MKTIRFIDSDKELIDKIKEYQLNHGLSSFVSAVRKLCTDALKVAKITHWKEWIQNGRKDFNWE